VYSATPQPGRVAYSFFDTGVADYVITVKGRDPGPPYTAGPFIGVCFRTTDWTSGYWLATGHGGANFTVNQPSAANGWLWAGNGLADYNTWYWMKAEVRGTSIKTYRSTDGVTWDGPVHDVVDSTFATGNVGVFTGLEGTATAEIDEILVDEFRSDFNLEYADPAPTIDGVMGTGEWEGATLVQHLSSSDSLGGYEVEGGDTDLSADVYMMWDQTYLYLLVDVTDDVLIDSIDEGGQVWFRDEVEIYLDGAEQYGADIDGITASGSGSPPLSAIEAAGSGKTLAGQRIHELKIDWLQATGDPWAGREVAAYSIKVWVADDDVGDGGYIQSMLDGGLKTVTLTGGASGLRGGDWALYK